MKTQILIKMNYEDKEVLEWGKRQVHLLQEKWSDAKDVPWNDFKNYEVGKKHYLKEGLMLLITYMDDKYMNIYCEMYPGSKLYAHFHSTHVEIFRIIEGEMYDTNKTDNWSLKIGDTYEYQVNEIHEPYVKELTKILINCRRA